MDLHAHEIIPGIWLGDAHSSNDETFIRSQKIDVVFNCTKNLPFSYLIPIKYRVPVDDNLQEEEIRNMGLWATEIAYLIIMNYRKGHHILVHCMAGRQRSAASVAIALIAIKRMKTSEAIQFIRSKRQVAFYPSPNFLASIQSFEKTFFTEYLPQLEGKEIQINTL